MSPLVDKYVLRLQSQATRPLRVWFFFSSLNSCLAAWET